MKLEIDSDLSERFPGLRVLITFIRSVKIEKESPEQQKYAESLVEKIKRKYSVETLKDLPTFRAYRDFFWQIGTDPTKNRPAAEALIRRVLANKPLPQINTLVDAYNLASIKTGVAMAAFDADELRGDLLMRFAREGEEFLGIGMEKPMELGGHEIVISDTEKLIAIYPYRDSDQTKVTLNTKNVLLLICGVLGLKTEFLSAANQVAIECITRFCNGKCTL